MEILIDNEWAILEYDASKKLMMITWKKVVNSDEYIAVNTEVLQALVKHAPYGYVADIRKQGVIGPENAKWMTEVAQPKAVEVGVKKLAIIIDNDIFKKFYADNLKKSVVEMGSGVTLQYFMSPEEAIAFASER